MRAALSQYRIAEGEERRLLSLLEPKAATAPPAPYRPFRAPSAQATQ